MTDTTLRKPEQAGDARVTALRPDMEARERARFALQALEAALTQLEVIVDANEVMLNAEQVDILDDIHSRLDLLRPRVKMRRSVLHLASVFGRSPT